MPNVLAYHRPASLDEAAGLASGPNAKIIGGGTVAVPAARKPSDEGVEIVDLQALGLDEVRTDGDRVSLGAMVRLGDLMNDASVPSVLRDLARRELPSALRNQATVGGTVAQRDGESVLLAGLLAFDATVDVHGAGTVSLADYLAQAPAGIVTAVSVATAGAAAVEGTGRTPADVPIVAAVARVADGNTTVALTGVASCPVLVDPSDPAQGLEPQADFRGSAQYRLHLAKTLTTRAIAAAQR
ncbi:MAG: FAD binding domain-containing protein [Acidimicrobiales bacterium]|nr:FAD binding domain-containing protein [Acidimicrobiales bacterium]